LDLHQQKGIEHMMGLHFSEIFVCARTTDGRSKKSLKITKFNANNKKMNEKNQTPG
jgi:hypothetical protein